MRFLDRIISYLVEIEDWFHEAYLEVRGWIAPFSYLYPPLYYIYRSFYYLTLYFSDFNDWVDDIASQVTDILSWSTIRSYIRSWLPDLEDVIDWWDRWWKWVSQEIDDWWAVTWSGVRSWVYARIDDVEELIDSVELALGELQADISYLLDQIPSVNEILSWFTNWWGSILSAMVDWGALTATQIDTLIDSWFKSYQPFWEGWLDWKDKVTEFFTDPEDWLYKAVDRIFERFW